MKHFHAVEFDGITFGMDIDAQSNAYRAFKKHIVCDRIINSFGYEVKVLTVPYLYVAALMGESHWLVSERKLFDKISIEGLYDGAYIYVKYKEGLIDFRDRK